DVLYQGPGILKHFNGSRSKDAVFEDTGIGSFQLPCMKERRPIDKRHQSSQWKVIQYSKPEKRRLGRPFLLRPVQVGSTLPRIAEREQRNICSPAQIFLPGLVLFDSIGFDERTAELCIDQAIHDADRA